jgi:glycosyltransferase involved in cell wall biosynthesis
VLQKAKKRIAFLGRGGHTLPSHRALLNKLSNDFTIVLFSEIAIQPEWLNLSHRYEIRCFKGMGLHRLFREPIFIFMLLIEQLRNPFDLVHAHSTLPTGLASVMLQIFFGVPALVSLDGGEGVFIPESKFGDFNSRKITILNKWILNQATAVTALTHFQRDIVINNLKLKRKIEVISRGVDIDIFKFEMREIPKPIIFLSVGYLSPIKNPEMLLKTFYLIQQKLDCHLIHIGKDYMDGEVQRGKRVWDR